ncbi:hypothetical protein KC725_01805 [Candidatus Peregrinibacteria bacterium]|nr:hypothetical protein [Candidatus Peregrinibacteria bacterium]
MSKSEYQMLVESKKSAKKEVVKGTSVKDPLLVVFAPNKGLKKDEFFQLLEGMLILTSNIVVVDDEEPASGEDTTKGKITWVNMKDGRNDAALEKYLEAADMALVFEEHMGDVARLLAHGVVVVGLDKSPLLENYNASEETGNAFTFAKMGPWEIFRALVRAHETYSFPYDWKHIVRGILQKTGSKEE